MIFRLHFTGIQDEDDRILMFFYSCDHCSRIRSDIPLLLVRPVPFCCVFQAWYRRGRSERAVGLGGDAVDTCRGGVRAGAIAVAASCEHVPIMGAVR